MVRFLKEKGFRAAGYDPYSPDHCEPCATHERFDCIVARADPHAVSCGEAQVGEVLGV